MEKNKWYAGRTGVSRRISSLVYGDNDSFGASVHVTPFTPDHLCRVYFKCIRRATVLVAYSRKILNTAA